MSKSREWIRQYANDILKAITPSIEEYTGVTGCVNDNDEFHYKLFKEIEAVIINKEIGRLYDHGDS